LSWSVVEYHITVSDDRDIVACRIIGKYMGGHHVKTRHTVGLTLLAGIAIGAAAVQGLHAQAKVKAYSVSELDTVDSAAQAAYLPSARQAIEAHHGKALRTAAGRVVQIEGAAPPKNVAIVEWDSVRRTGILQIGRLEGDAAPAGQGV
jgi:uncharacterized protein (DUF1330 family)